MTPAGRACVYLVGAGPGDPSLISLRGVRCLQRADVVVYDHKVQERVLRFAPARAERIDVGPAAPRPLEQEAISLLLAEKAREGRIVVRLKWGDPYVFDSGGKEALFLHEQRIPFEVVPGVPAAVGAPAYAGVPVTYPGASDLLILIRGHESETDMPPQVDWAALSKLEASVVCYAGPRQAPVIAQAMLQNGRPEDDPAALIFDGTLPSQTTQVTTLGAVAREGLGDDRRPALLFVGQVTNLREHLRWFDVRPLFGRRIVVTRSRAQAGSLVEMIEEAGAEAIELPTVREVNGEETSALEDAVVHASTFDWIVFASARAVDRFLEELLAGEADIRVLHGVKLCAIGPTTADRLAVFGIKADLAVPEFRVDVIAETLTAGGAPRVLIVRPDYVRDTLANELHTRGAHPNDVIAYRTAMDAEAGQDLYRMLLEGTVDAVTFVSASAVRHFVEMIGHEQAVDLLNTTVVAAIGPVTAEAAAQLGISVQVVPSIYSERALVEALSQHFATSTLA